MSPPPLALGCEADRRSPAPLPANAGVPANARASAPAKAQADLRLRRLPPEGRLPYLSLGEVLVWEPLAAAWGVAERPRACGGFVARFRKAAGCADLLPLDVQIAREALVRRALGQILSADDGRLFDPDDGLPTRRALGLVFLAYFPRPVHLARRFALLQNARVT